MMLLGAIGIIMLLFALALWAGHTSPRDPTERGQKSQTVSPDYGAGHTGPP